MGAHAPSAHAWQQLGEHLRRARQTHRVSQEFLAHWIDVDRRSIDRIERGQPRMLVSELAELEMALALRPGVSLSVLVGASEVSRPQSLQLEPRRPPTLRELSSAATLCGHNPTCR
ncbi:helix-turn-helix domain-containing protein [Streptomyces mutabilis]|uniref:helix-turn-helix domain-containing protein n=1 Tax=Streptomyces mutabilis TaxID=67332 RepID=UPI00364FE5C7